MYRLKTVSPRQTNREPTGVKVVLYGILFSTLSSMTREEVTILSSLIS